MQSITKELSGLLAKHTPAIVRYLSREFGRQKFFQKRTKAKVGNIAIDYSYQFYNDPNFGLPLIFQLDASIESNSITFEGSYTTILTTTIINKVTKRSKLLTVEYPEGPKELDTMLKNTMILFPMSKINNYLKLGY